MARTKRVVGAHETGCKPTVRAIGHAQYAKDTAADAVVCMGRCGRNRAVARVR